MHNVKSAKYAWTQFFPPNLLQETVCQNHSTQYSLILIIRYKNYYYIVSAIQYYTVYAIIAVA